MFSTDVGGEEPRYLHDHERPLAAWCVARSQKADNPEYSGCFSRQNRCGTEGPVSSWRKHALAWLFVRTLRG